MVIYIHHLTFSFVSSDNLFNICYKWQNTPAKLMAEEFGNLPLADKVIPEIKEKFVVDYPNQAVAKLLLHFGEECIARRFTSNRHYDPCERDLGEIRWAEEGKDGYTNDCTLLPIPAQDLELTLQLLYGNTEKAKEYDTLLAFYQKWLGEETLAKIKAENAQMQRSVYGEYLIPVVIFS